MSDYYDSWRHNQPAAPHAPSHDRHMPGLAPSEQGPPTSREDDWPTPPAAPSSAPPNMAGVAVAELFLLFIFAAPLFGTLYPMAAGAALAAGLATRALLGVTAPGLGADGRLPFALLAAAAVFWPVSRFDHRLAERNRAYRAGRHVARVVILAFALTFWTFGRRGGAATSMLLMVAVWGVVAHLVLTRAERFRAHWHGLLQLAQLRPS
jgi:hypothetical protein